MGHAAHELEPLLDEMVPAPQATACDAPANTTNDPTAASVHADKPDAFASWPMGHAAHELAPVVAAIDPAAHEMH